MTSNDSEDLVVLDRTLYVYHLSQDYMHVSKTICTSIKIRCPFIDAPKTNVLDVYLVISIRT